MKLSNEGALIWKKRIGDYSACAATSVIEDSNRGVLLSGVIFPSWTISPNNEMRAVLARFDGNGEIDGPCGLVKDTDLTVRDSPVHTIEVEFIFENMEIESGDSHAVAEGSGAVFEYLCPE